MGTALSSSLCRRHSFDMLRRSPTYDRTLSTSCSSDAACSIRAIAALYDRLSDTRPDLSEARLSDDSSSGASADSIRSSSPTPSDLVARFDRGMTLADQAIPVRVRTSSDAALAGRPALKRQKRRWSVFVDSPSVLRGSAV